MTRLSGGEYGTLELTGLFRHDARHRVIDWVKERYSEAASGFESTAEPSPVPLSARLATVRPVEKAAARPPLTLAEALAR